jgi:hypothetical protein
MNRTKEEQLGLVQLQARQVDLIFYMYLSIITIILVGGIIIGCLVQSTRNLVYVSGAWLDLTRCTWYIPPPPPEEAAAALVDTSDADDDETM